MKILHFIDSLRSGGKERQLVELFKGLSAHKHIKCDIATMSHDIHYPEVLKLDIKIHYLIRTKKKDLKLIPKLYMLCKKIQPDIIHTWGSFPSLFTAPVVKISGIKFINGTIRKAPVKLKLFSEDWMRSKITFPFSDKIVANSFAGMKSYNVPLRKSICIHNGFDFKRIRNLQDPETVRQKFYITTDKVVGMVATFSDNKDYKTFLLSAQSILMKRDNVTFVAVGDGQNFDKCKRLIMPCFQEKIKFLGNQNDVESIINIFDIGVLATYTEGLSNSIMEYMALGKPVVATENDGNKELVINEKTGFLVKQKDKSEMDLVITRLLYNKNQCIKMGNSSRERIHKFFSLQKMTESYIELYKEVLAI